MRKYHVKLLDRKIGSTAAVAKVGSAKGAIVRRVRQRVGQVTIALAVLASIVSNHLQYPFGWTPDENAEGLFLSASATALSAILGIFLAAIFVITQLSATFNRHTIRRATDWWLVSVLAIYVFAIATGLLALLDPTSYVRLSRWVTDLDIVALGSVFLVIDRLRRAGSVSDAIRRVEQIAISPRPSYSTSEAIATLEAFGSEAMDHSDLFTLLLSIQAMKNVATAAIRTDNPSTFEEAITAIWELSDRADMKGRIALGVAESAREIVDDQVRIHGVDSNWQHAASAMLELCSALTLKCVASGERRPALIFLDQIFQLGAYGTQNTKAAAHRELAKIRRASSTLNRPDFWVTGSASTLLAHLPQGITHHSSSGQLGLNLLANGSGEFGERGDWAREAGWYRANHAGEVWLDITPAEAGGPSSPWVIEMQVGPINGSIAQDVTGVDTLSYALSAFMRQQSHRGAEAHLTLWALGGAEERADTETNLELDWKMCASTLDPRHIDHSRLRVEVYSREAGSTIWIDDCELVPCNLSNAGFEVGNTAWQLVPAGSGILRVIRDRSAVPEFIGGEMFARVEAIANTRLTQSSSLSANWPQTAYWFLWVRLASDSPAPHDRAVRLSARIEGSLEETYSEEHIAAPEWRLLACPLELPEGEVSIDVGLEIPAGVTVDCDSGCLLLSGLRNAAFTSISGWTSTSGSLVQIVTDPGPHKIKNYLSLGRGSVMGNPPSISQSIERLLHAGDSFAWGCWTRSNSKGSISLRVETTDGSFRKTFPVGPEWEFISLPVDTFTDTMLTSVTASYSEGEGPVFLAEAGLVHHSLRIGA
jgi:hypothetical protein